MQNGPKFSCRMHVLSESCMMIGQFGWETIDPIRAPKHLAAILHDVVYGSNSVKFGDYQTILYPIVSCVGS